MDRERSDQDPHQPSPASEWRPGYRLQAGASLDRSQLVTFLQRSYQEQYPQAAVAHLAQTVEQYFCADTPLWWVVPVADATPIAVLWLGTAVDQIQGDRHAYIFLLYVSPDHRRRGIGSGLMRQAEDWARARGDRQIGLQVFQQNQPALQLYQSLGYQPQSLWLVKLL